MHRGKRKQSTFAGTHNKLNQFTGKGKEEEKNAQKQVNILAEQNDDDNENNSNVNVFNTLTWFA